MSRKRPSVERQLATNLRKAAEVLQSPPAVPHPGRILAKHIGRGKRTSIRQLAEISMVSRPTIYKVLRGERPITQDTAETLEHLGVSTANKWLAAQRRYDEHNGNAEKFLRAAARFEEQIRYAEKMLDEANELARQLYSGKHQSDEQEPQP